MNLIWTPRKIYVWNIALHSLEFLIPQSPNVTTFGACSLFFFNLCLCLFLCLSSLSSQSLFFPSLSVSLLSFSPHLFLYPCFLLSLSLSISLSHLFLLTLFLFLSLSISVSLYIYFSVSLSLCLSLFLCLSVAVSFSLCLLLCLSLPCLYLPLCLSISSESCFLNLFCSVTKQQHV